MEQFEQLLANKWIVLGIFAFVFVTSMTVNIYLERQRKRKQIQNEQEGMAYAKPIEEPDVYVKLKPLEDLNFVIAEPEYKRIKSFVDELIFGAAYAYHENQLELVLLDIEECLRQMGISFDKGYFYFEKAPV